MATRINRRDLMQAVAAGAAAASIAAPASAQTENGQPEDYFYRDDYFGEPWRTPETVVLIHGNDESSIVWYAWVPQMAQQLRVIRPDLPAFGRSKVPPNFEWSLKSLATFIARVLDKAGVQSAHIVGAKTGGAIAMQFAADYPARTRTLSVASGPASVIEVTNPSPIPQHDRLGTNVSKEMIDYWNAMFEHAPEEGAKGLRTALSKFDLARDGVLQRIEAPTMIITADRSALQSVEKVRAYQLAIPNSRLVVLHSDAYHIAAANADECVTNVLNFIKETSRA
jgi:pimeloyl-ACP methyl ester carboxylesterase